MKMTNNSLEISQKGVLFSVLAGVFVGLAEISSFFVFSKGVSASVGISIIIWWFCFIRGYSWPDILERNYKSNAYFGDNHDNCRSFDSGHKIVEGTAV